MELSRVKRTFTTDPMKEAVRPPLCEKEDAKRKKLLIGKIERQKLKAPMTHWEEEG